MSAFLRSSKQSFGATGNVSRARLAPLLGPVHSPEPISMQRRFPESREERRKVLNTYDLRALTAVYWVTKRLRPTGEVCHLSRAELIDAILDAEYRSGPAK
jgi:hypothetical protein